MKNSMTNNSEYWVYSSNTFAAPIDEEPQTVEEDSAINIHRRELIRNHLSYLFSQLYYPLTDSEIIDVLDQISNFAKFHSRVSRRILSRGKNE